MTTDWDRYTVEFTTKNIVGSVDNARLRFWLALFARSGDVYMIDDVRLERTAGWHRICAICRRWPGGHGYRQGLLLGISAEEFDPAVNNMTENGNFVDDEAAICRDISTAHLATGAVTHNR
ncbi:MAG: hypothetical protein R2932_33280 [Caldilineaceae bacterium]